MSSLPLEMASSTGHGGVDLHTYSTIITPHTHTPTERLNQLNGTTELTVWKPNVP